MKALLTVLGAFSFAFAGCALAQAPAPFPQPGFILRGPIDKTSAHTEINPANGTFAVYGDANSMIQTASLSLSADGSMLSVGATPGTVDLWDVSKHKLLKTFSGGDIGELSRDGKLLATGEIAIYDTASHKQRCRAPWHSDDAAAIVNRIRFSPDSRFLAVTANGSDMFVLDAQSCKKVADLTRTKDGDFTLDGSRFFAANYQVYTVWQVDGWKLLATFSAGPDYTNSVAVSPDGQYALVAGPNNAKLVNIADGKIVRTYGSGWVSGVGFLSDKILMVRDHQELTFRTVEGEVLCSDSSLLGGEMSLAANGAFAISAVHQRDALLYSAEAVRHSCSGLK